MLALIKSMLRQNGYKLFTRPYELNIVGVRNNSTISNRFDDALVVFYRAPQGGVLKWHVERFAITTDPGTYWLNNPSYESGTAILKPGQYRNAYQIGLHRGKYEALVQRRPVTILRDYDRDAVLDFFNGTEYYGLFGINIHRANASGTSESIEKYSAGCQVFADAEDFSLFMQLCKKHAQLYGNAFTYTLFDHRAEKRTYKLYTLFGLGFVAASTIIGVGLYMDSQAKTEKGFRARSSPQPLAAVPDYMYEEAEF
jgi:hypothetical protein